MKRISKERHDRVLNSPVGQFIEIREEFARGGDCTSHWEGNVIQALWREFTMPINGLETFPENETKFNELPDERPDIDALALERACNLALKSRTV